MQPYELQWAMSHFETDEYTHIRDLPWSKVFQLRNKQYQAYLKVVPEHRRQAITAAVTIAEYFPQHTPHVLAFQQELACQLSVGHGGQTLNENNHADLSKVLSTYAEMQAEAKNSPHLLSKLPPLNIAETLSLFAEFLSPNSYLQQVNKLDLGCFLDEQTAQNYYTLFQSRFGLLNPFLQQAQYLPTTLNHCDLRAANIAMSAQQQPVLFDWDEVTAGPAGLSLHNFFNGCHTVYKCLKNIESDDIPEYLPTLLHTYIQALTKHQYASETLIKRHIAASAALGVIHYILSFSDYPTMDDNNKTVIAINIQRSLEDLLKLCDCLILDQEQHPNTYWQDYIQTQYFGGIDHIGQLFYQNNTYDADVTSVLLQSQLTQGQSQQATQLLDQAIEKDANNAQWWHLRGRLHTQHLQLSQALSCLKQSIQLQASEECQQDLQFTQYLFDIEEYARHPQHIPTIRCNEQWQSLTDTPNEILALGAKLFQQHGTLILKGMYSPKLIQAIRSSFEENYVLDHHDLSDGRALQVGDKRYMQSLPLGHSFNHPDFYAPPLLQGIMQHSLGEQHILGSFTCVTALAGAGEQQLHKDHPALFDSSDEQPCFAVTCLIPFVPFVEGMGGTRVFKQTQNLDLNDSAQMSSQAAELELGDCLLFDYRLTHQGLANTSNQDRPVLSLVYQRAWFRDTINFNKQAALSLSSNNLDTIPEAYRSLFQWTTY